MKRAASGSSERGREHAGSFLPIFDSRKRKVAGLWRRRARYYVQHRVDLGNGLRVDPANERTAPRRMALDAANL